MDFKTENHLNQLRGKYLSNIGRSYTMIWLSFSDEIISKNEKEESQSNTLNLHLECPCRMINKSVKKIFFAFSDKYVPKSSDEWSEEFEWDIQGNNLFDEKSREWLLSNQDLFIKDYKLNSYGDLILTFSNGDVFEVLITSTSSDEDWRLFEKGSDKEHLVKRGNSLEFE